MSDIRQACLPFLRSADTSNWVFIPTVYCEDYMGALRKLTLQRIADAYARTLLRASAFRSTLGGGSIEEMTKHLIKGDAFKVPNEGKFPEMFSIDVSNRL